MTGLFRNPRAYAPFVRAAGRYVTGGVKRRNNARVLRAHAAERLLRQPEPSRAQRRRDVDRLADHVEVTGTAHPAQRDLAEMGLDVEAARKRPIL